MKTIPDGFYLKLPPDPFQTFKGPKQTSDLSLADEAKTYYHTISKGQNPIDEISKKKDKWISAEEIILYLYFYQSVRINQEAFFKPASPAWGNLSKVSASGRTGITFKRLNN